MDLIDDEGRLFGVVNVIDALVILFVFAVLLAGIALVDPFTTREEATRYATVDLGAQPEYLLTQVTTGDVMELENSPDNLTITDVYHGPSENTSQLIVRVRLNGEVNDPSDGPPQFLFNGEPFLVGQPLTIKTLDYTTKGQATAIALEGAQLPTKTTPIIAVANVSPSEADRLDVGDAYQVGGESVAVIRDLQQYPAPDSQNRLAILGVELTTIERGSTTRFGPSEVRLGTRIPFETADYDLQPQIIDLGTADIATAETPVVLEGTVPTSIVDDIQTGDTFEIGGDTIATLESVAVYPIPDRTRKRVVLGATLLTRNTGDRRLFGDKPVQVGTTLRFQTTAYDLTGDVIRVNAIDPPGEETTTTATIAVKNVPPPVANAIHVGQTETVRGETIARVTDRESQPAAIILTSETGNIFEREHPRHLDLTLTVELETRRTTAGLRFHGEPVQIGDTVILDFGPVTVEGEIADLEG